MPPQARPTALSANVSRKPIREPSITTPGQAKRLVEQGLAVLLSVEEQPAEYIPGSLLIPRSQLARRAGEIPEEKLIILCYPFLSIQADPETETLFILDDAGVKNQVSILDGGVEGWKRSGYATKRP